MPGPLRQRNPGRSIAGILLWEVLKIPCGVIYTLLWRYRAFGQARVPPAGPLIVVMNHQSHLDPVAAGLAMGPRHLNYLARATLFIPGFGLLIRALNSVPVRQGGEIAAIRAAVEQLAMGRAVLVFPEGSRTPDGAMHTFKRGVWLLINRAQAPVLPMAVEGAFDTFPRGRALPRLGGPPIRVNVGEVIPRAALIALGPGGALRHLEERVEALRLDLHARLRREGATLTTLPALVPAPTG